MIKSVKQLLSISSHRSHNIIFERRFFKRLFNSLKTRWHEQESEMSVHMNIKNTSFFEILYEGAIKKKYNPRLMNEMGRRK